MRFQPGEPSHQVNAVDQCQWESKLILAYCSGNNLIIFENGSLLQTVYLPSDGVSININSRSGHICVTLANSVWILEPQRSFSKGLSWSHTKALAAPNVTDCRWIDTQLLLIGDFLELRNSDDEVLWKEKVSPVKQCSVSSDFQQFTCFDGNLIKLWSRVSQSSPAFDFDYLRHPAQPLWCHWVDEVLFTWCADRVLRAFRPLKTGRYELCATVQLPKRTTPAILCDGDSIYILYMLDEQCYMVHMDMSRSFVVVEYAWKNIPIIFHNVRRVWDMEECIRIYAVVRDKRIHFTAHKWGSLILASTMNLLLQRPSKVELFVSGIYTGHLKSIKRICRSSLGYELFTQTRFSENYVWDSYKLLNGETTVAKKSLVDVTNPTHADLLEDKNLITIAGHEMILWDPSTEQAKRLCQIEIKESPLLLGSLTYKTRAYCIAVYRDHIKTWSIDDACLVPLPDSHLSVEVKRAVMVDPVGWLATFDRDVLTTISADKIRTWSLKISDDGVFEWIETSQFDTSAYLDPKQETIKVQMSSRKKLVVAQSGRLLIWDAINDVIEFDKIIENETVHDIDWTTTPTGECLLGVGFSSRVVIYCPQRYDYTKRLEAWIPIRELDIGKYTPHEIGDSIWLKDGTFVIGAGNQLFIQDSQVNFEDEKVRELLKERNTISSLEQSSSIFDINAVLNGPLPVFHPQFLIQLIFSGRIDLACKILCHLLKAIKYAVVTDPPHVTAIVGYWLDLTPDVLDTRVESEFNAEVAHELEQQLERKALNYLTRHQQITLLSVVQSLAKIEQSLDQCGIKYMLGFQLFRLHSQTQHSMNMRDFVWGSISSCKQVLLDAAEQAGAMTKLALFQQYGLMFWSERHTLIEKAEQLAKRIFAVSRNPVEVTLLYLALRKKQLLVGLWRISSSHPEQAKTLKLLSNDFDNPRWKAAALKNAYALMSKHRYEYAAGLFLLGGAVKDACNILGRQLNNLPLAFLVARLYDGDDGEAMRYLIDRFLCDEDEDEGDDIYSHKHWMQVWAYMTIGDVKSAVKAATTIRGSRAKRTVTDPVLIWMYSHLRSKYSLVPKEESRALLRTSTIYRSMGCDVIALHMLADWEFSHETGVTPTVSVMPSAVPSPSETPIEAPSPQLPEPIEAPAAAQFDLSAFGF